MLLVVSDVHAAFGSLGRVARSGKPILVLGDLVNLIDYRTNEGIVADVIGLEAVEHMSWLRLVGRHDDARAYWIDHVATLDVDVPSAIRDGLASQYDDMRTALEGAHAYVTYGNADDPAMLERSLPGGCRFVDGQVIEIDGVRFGFAGGGVPRIGTRGEVSHDAMRAKLSALGHVDVLCTHVPPAIPMLAEDVIAGSTKGSPAVLEYLDEFRPRFHLFGDVHQPRATRWIHGTTECRNVGYFRATGRPFPFVA